MGVRLLLGAPAFQRRHKKRGSRKRELFCCTDVNTRPFPHFQSFQLGHKLLSMQPDSFKADRERFDRDAALWDGCPNPHRAALASACREALAGVIEGFATSPSLFDYGCGTGAVSLPLAQMCASITGCDFSEGMLAQFAKNAASLGLDRVRTLQLDLSGEAPIPPERYDIAHCGMVMHHIVDIPAFFCRISEVLRHGGTLSLIDAEPEDGSFHDDNSGVAHYGLNPDQLCQQLEGMGYDIIHSRRIHTVEKPRAGQMKPYPIFHIVARMQD